MREIEEIILHCTATKPDQNITAAVIDRWHRKRGWKNGIGYHFVVLRNGVVEQGRPLDLGRAHCKGRNSRSIGIAYCGGINAAGKPENNLTAAQDIAIRNLVLVLRAMYGTLELHGHNEYSSKACPSFNVQEVYQDLV